MGSSNVAGPAVTVRASDASPTHEDPSFDDSDDIMDGGVAIEDFISTGRTGRRNAVADITDARVGGVSTAGVDFSFDQLSVSDSKSGGSDSSKQSGSSSGDKSQPVSKS
ncbi:hypothetical protein PoB_007225600 [Plakobranchus ocellatus]|uniref:Uncharacterized protein n=1 Tax=Plakobranchus ocellatus TaxID=259542 RepID=A0AAV4DPF1_9GAST|nr:hypothetical protein PoB_007225600 [Plakobranchus ocellatus]